MGKSRRLTELQKTMLVNAHPVKMIFNLIGASIGFYFLWWHQWLPALIFGFGMILLGTVLSLSKIFGKYDLNRLSRTFLGRLHLRYTTGIGFVLYLGGHMLIPYAFWAHSLFAALLGILFLVAGALIYEKVRS